VIRVGDESVHLGGHGQIHQINKDSGADGVDNHAAFIGEGSVDLVADILPSVSLRVGYEVLFLTDLEGSTPYNLCCKRCEGKSVVLSGMNLPMLFKLATADRKHGALPLAEATDCRASFGPSRNSSTATPPAGLPRAISRT